MTLRVSSQQIETAEPVCLHCGLPTPADSRFCCTGCEAAYAFINGAGFGAYYERRLLDAGKPVLRPEASDLVEIGAYIKNAPDGISEIHLMVDGIQCGACVWLVESILAKTAGVVSGRMNMTTRRLHIRWQNSTINAAATRIEDVLSVIESLGYKLAPYDPVVLKSLSDRTDQMLVKALAVAGFSAGNLMLLAVGVWVGFSQGMGDATRGLLHWVSAIIALPAIAYAGRPFFQSALSALKHGRTNMDVPISLGVILVTGMSLWETIAGGAHTYFDSAAMLLFFLLIGRVLDRRARGRAREAAEHLIGLRITEVSVLNADGTIDRRKQDGVRIGERVLVRTGERIGVDGIIECGQSHIDMSIVTGESLPVVGEPSIKVFAGSINLGNPLRILVTATGEATLLAECVRLIEAAEQGRGRFIVLADRVAKLYAPVVHVAALMTFLVWWLGFSAPWTHALFIAVSVLIITCPCALALAVPAVQVIATGGLLRKGILLKSPTALERLAAVDTIVFDKTGTLTEPGLQLHESKMLSCDDINVAASLCAASNHPLARTLVAAASSIKPRDSVEEIAGAGLRCRTAEGEIRVGSAAFCAIETSHHAGPELWLKRPDHAPVSFHFDEKPRGDAADIVSDLKADGYAISLLSGDHAAPVSTVAKAIGIDIYASGLSPVGKVERLTALQDDGHKVLMVGDGLNDSPALAAASVSMSPSSAMDLSQTIADVVFQGKMLQPVETVLRMAKSSQRLIKQNIALSILYNLVMVPLAVAGFVTPWVAAAAMSASSLIVIVNSLRLNWEGRG